MIPVEVHMGSVAELHALDPLAGEGPTHPTLWWCRPTDDAIVLGSRQRDDLLDRAACERSGLSIVRRRSGGGAVIMRRATTLWIDVILPVRAAPDDVRASMVLIGEWWCDALSSLAPGPLTVHRGGMQRSPWSDLVCFAGVGPGEVMAGADKLVGLSQRRTRRGIRVQGLIYGASVAHEYRPVLRGDLPHGDPCGQGSLPGIDHDRLVGELARRITPV